MKKRFIIFLLFNAFVCLFYHYGLSQREGFNWRFGYKAGLKFNDSGPPTVVHDSRLASIEGGSAISDSSGNLLFYTNGLTVWDKNNDTIVQKLKCCVPNDWLSPEDGTSSTQGVLILPGKNKQYWIFTVSDSLVEPSYFPYVTTYLRYHIIDNNGNVLKKNVIAYDLGARTEKLLAVRHTNGRDWWLITQNNKNGLEYYHKFIFNGADLLFKNTQTFPTVNPKFLGCMKASPSGNKICVAKSNSSFSQEKLLLLDFDRCLGMLSNRQDISVNVPSNFSPYGCEFSPKEKKLYVSSTSTYYPAIAQFNLETPNIPLSFQIIYQFPDEEEIIMGNMVLGPDNKIYMTNTVHGPSELHLNDSLNNHLTVINKPELSEAACEIAPYSFYIGPDACLTIGLPNIPNYALGALYDIPLSDAGPGRTYCGGDSVGLGTPAVAGTVYRWCPALGLSDTAAAQPLAAPDITTIYTLSIINEAGDSCYFNQDMVTVYVPAFPAGFSAFTDGFNASFAPNAVGQNLTYLWKFGDGDSAFLKNPTHIYPDTGSYTVTLLLIDTISGCQKIVIDTLQISVSSTIENCQTQTPLLQIYPNPARTEVRLRYQGAENICPMEVLDPQGKLVKRFTIENDVETVFDVSDLSPGLYLFKAKINGENLTHKIIINR